MRTALGEKLLSHASEKNITALSAEQEVSKLNLYTVFRGKKLVFVFIYLYKEHRKNLWQSEN